MADIASISTVSDWASSSSVLAANVGSINGILASPGIGGIDEFTKLMLHMDESPLIDSSLEPHALTLSGGVARSSVQKKFGGYSGYYDGDDNSIEVADHADFEFGNGDFSIDFWSYPVTGYVGAGEVVSKGDITSYGPFVIYHDATKWHFVCSYNGTDWATDTEFGDAVVDTWQHMAVCRSGSTVYFFKDGVEQTTFNISTNSLFENNELLRIGSALFESPLFYKGYIEELRISKGVARWVTGFTPNTKAYN
jgi:hypothetical protein